MGSLWGLGSLWGPNVSLWVPMYPYGCQWLPMAPYVSLCVLMYLYGVPMALYVSLWGRYGIWGLYGIRGCYGVSVGSVCPAVGLLDHPWFHGTLCLWGPYGSL